MTRAEQKYEFNKRYEIKDENYVNMLVKVYVAYDKQDNNKVVVLVVENAEDDFSYHRYDGFKSLKAAKENAFKLASMLDFKWTPKHN